MIGWIKIHRKFLDWEWFNKSEAVHLFMYLILKANHKDGQWQGIDVYKGQFITSYGKISVDTGISLQTIRTLLKKFEKTNEIEKVNFLLEYYTKYDEDYNRRLFNLINSFFEFLIKDKNIQLYYIFLDNATYKIGRAHV